MSAIVVISALNTFLENPPKVFVPLKPNPLPIVGSHSLKLKLLTLKFISLSLVKPGIAFSWKDAEKVNSAPVKTPLTSLFVFILLLILCITNVSAGTFVPVTLIPGVIIWRRVPSVCGAPATEVAGSICKTLASTLLVIVGYLLFPALTLPLKP